MHKYNIKISKLSSSSANVGIIRNSIKEIIENNKDKLDLLKEILILIESITK